MREYAEAYIEHEDATERIEEAVCGYEAELAGHYQGWESAKTQVARLEKSYSRAEIVNYLKQQTSGI